MEMNPGGYCDVCVSLRQRSYKQRWTNPGCQVTQVTTLCMVAPNIFITIITVVFLANKYVYQIMCTMQKVPETRKFTSHSRTVGH